MTAVQICICTGQRETGDAETLLKKRGFKDQLLLDALKKVAAGWLDTGYYWYRLAKPTEPDYTEARPCVS